MTPAALPSSPLMSSPAPGATGGGPVVPLDTLAHATEVVGPQAVNHFGQLPSVTVSFGLAPGVFLGPGAGPCG